MLKLVDLLKEEENKPTEKLTPKELVIYNKALALLQSEEDVLEEGLKDSLKKLGLTAAIAASLLASPGITSAQKAAIQQASATTSQTAPTSDIYSGNPKMDAKSYRDNVLKKYKATNPKFWVSSDSDVAKVQDAIKVYRAWTLQQWREGKAQIVGVEYSKASPEERAQIESKFMAAVPKTEQDGKNGQFTSQFRFPGAFLKDLNSGEVLNLGIEGNKLMGQAAGNLITVDQMKEWNSFVEWMKNPTSNTATYQVKENKLNESFDEVKRMQQLAGIRLI